MVVLNGVGTAVHGIPEWQGEHDAFKQLALSRVSAVLVLGASVVEQEMIL